MTARVRRGLGFSQRAVAVIKNILHAVIHVLFRRRKETTAQGCETKEVS